ncbi:CtsR family transcriptional regulator [Desulfitobacterium metallireducens]|uniref:Transcriptional regulator CtsR n=1 Tax=Desulfitobacterium metallireducens DSM 15288 TaxID=871968 RepID=W0E8L6_9FIRM|nr:CtsR family transcriptional regulator [Desulfitobacterium metallireducens]AHF05863.1 CtsR family transcriptional regulator [Desulfitobacterium metallireducens DSM 15288]
MSNLADRIESYLKKILEETDEGFVVLQRGVLAGEFSCAPSQINYVLGTRFTVERGYLVESRRGGGGYLRIVRLGWNQDSQFQGLIRQLIGDQLTYERALGLLKRLLEEEVVSSREAALIRTMLHPDSLNNDVFHPDILRAHMMKRILTTLSREDLI